MGFRTLYRKDIFDQNRYFAGTEARRAEEFMELISNEGVNAIMFARGGYGSQRVIPLLDAKVITAHPKPVVGFSDLTALLTFLRQSAGQPTFYGPVVTQLGKAIHGATQEALRRALTTGGAMGRIATEGARVMKPGTATGRLVGGCLTLINSSIGTPYELETEGAALFIEDAGEKVYALDRMITQLKASGALEEASAIIVGSMEPPEGERHDVDAMLADVLGDFEGPILVRFPAGHAGEFTTLPMGVVVSIEAKSDGEPPSMTITEGLLS